MPEENRKPITIHKAVQTPISKCLRCQTKLGAATGLDAKQPREGDVSVCVMCGLVMQFTNELTLRKADDEVINSLRTSQPDTWELINLISQNFAAKRARREN